MHDAFGRFRRREFLRTVPNHVLELIAKALQHGVVNVEIGAVFGDRRRHDRRLAKQPLVIVLGNHRRIIYEIP